MTITTNDDRDEYTATASQTVFNYTFKIFASTDLNVYQTPAGQTADDSTDLITAYTVSGVGNAAGGTITLTTPASAGDLITIVSNVPSSRTTDYQISGDFIPATVNNDMDRMVSLAKQAEGLARRSLLFPESQQGVQAKVLPKPDNGKIFAWSESGEVVYRSITDLATTIDINSTVDAYPHMADFITRTPTKDMIYVESYATWSPGVTTPKGAHFRYRTGGTNTSPTVGSPVAVSTIGTGTQAGYAWDASGAEWFLSDTNIGDMTVFGLSGGTTDETAKFEAAIASGTNIWVVPYNAAGYTINTLTNSGTTFIFDGNSPMNGTQSLEGLGFALDKGEIGGVLSAPDLKDKKIEVVCGTIRQEQPAAVSGITRSGTSAICVETAHGRAVGEYVVIRGADQTGYNGTHEIAQVDNEDTYRFLVDSGLTTPATGTITVFGADVWEWIKDSTHEPLGVDDSTPIRSDGSGNGILIPFTKTYSKVLSFVCGPDETIAGAQGMVIGASVSTSAAALRASLNKTVAGRVYWNGSAWAVSMGTDQGTIYTTNAPYPFDDISYSGGNLTINHSFCLGSDVRLTAHSGNGAVTPYFPVIKSITDSGCVINFLYVNAGSLALYTGAESTSLSVQFTKNSNRQIKFDGSDRSSETSMYFGNVWFYGIMQV